MQNNKELDEQINAVSRITRLSPYVIEKDLFVTKAISIVSEVQHDMFNLIFQGGTSLAKAHRIIERMSEDCDFRIRNKLQNGTISKEYRRKSLRELRHQLVDALKNSEFKIDKANIRVRNEGQFMALRANYPSMYPSVPGIKPFIALEFFLAEVKVEPVIKSVTILIKQVLGEQVDHAEFPVSSVAIIETAAEKWVALTRRVATSKFRKYYRDPNLVRHMYDLYRINELGYFTDAFSSLVKRIVADDCKHYKTHNDDYANDSASEIIRALKELNQSQAWRDDWERFVDVMVFSKQKPSYEQALANLQQRSVLALSYLSAPQSEKIH